MAVQVPAEVLRRGVLHALSQADHLGLLGHHVDNEIGGQAVGAVGEPLDQVSVGQRCHPDRAALVVDLGVIGQNFKLGHHIAELAQLPAAQAGGGVCVQHGNLVIRDFLHLSGEVTALDRQQLAVSPRPQHHPGADGAHGDGRNQDDQCQERDRALLLHKLDIALDAIPLEAGGHHRADAVHGAAEEEEYIELLGVEVDGRQLHVKIRQSEHQRHRQVDERPGKGVADGLPGLAGALGPGGRSEAAGAIPLEAASGVSGVEALSEVEYKRHGSCSLL